MKYPLGCALLVALLAIGMLLHGDPVANVYALLVWGGVVFGGLTIAEMQRKRDGAGPAGIDKG